MLSRIYANPWTTIFLLIVTSMCINGIIDSLRGKQSPETGTENAGFFMPFFRDFPFFSHACIWCVSLHALLLRSLAFSRQCWRGLAVVMQLH
ncbi:MAG: hypothetical protein RSA95_07255 [Citrobacter sp.]|uniref:hypothetical protein n=1 Tax=Citrobacter sp. TaxID=1896336 RepID=UPI002FCAEA97